MLDVFDVIVGFIYYPYKNGSDITKIFSVAKVSVSDLNLLVRSV